MYIESWIVVVVVIVIVCLLVTITTQHNKFQSAAKLLAEQDKKELQLRRQLVNLLLSTDKHLLAKTTKATKDRIILEQADSLRRIFSASIMSFVVNGEVIEDRPLEFYIKNALGYEVEIDPEDDKATTASISEAIKSRLNDAE